MNKIRLAKFEIDKNHKLDGYVCENDQCIKTYIDKKSLIQPVSEIEYLVKITNETTSKDRRHLGDKIYFAQIICPRGEVTIGQLLALNINYEFTSDDLLLFKFTNCERDPQKKYFRICDYKSEVRILLPDVYEEFVTYEKEMANFYKESYNQKLENSDKQIISYPISRNVFQGCVSVFTSKEEVEEKSLYVINPTGYTENVSPVMYSESLEISRDCYVDNDIKVVIKNNIMNKFSNGEFLAGFSYLTQKSNTVYSQELAYSFTVCDEFKAVWVYGDIVVNKNSSCYGSTVEAHKNGLLVYKLAETKADDEFDYFEEKSYDIEFVRIYTAAELMPVFNHPEKTKELIESLVNNDNDVL